MFSITYSIYNIVHFYINFTTVKLKKILVIDFKLL